MNILARTLLVVVAGLFALGGLIYLGLQYLMAPCGIFFTEPSNHLPGVTRL